MTQVNRVNIKKYSSTEPSQPYTWPIFWSKHPIFPNSPLAHSHPNPYQRQSELSRPNLFDTRPLIFLHLRLRNKGCGQKDNSILCSHSAEKAGIIMLTHSSWGRWHGTAKGSPDPQHPDLFRHWSRKKKSRTYFLFESKASESQAVSLGNYT